MAARPQRRGSGPAMPRHTAQPVNEDFKPTSRWQEDNENHILTIDHPGFVQEQVKVSKEDHGIIRVHGERLVYRNRRARFHEDFQVPANSDMNRVRAMFEGGCLIVTVGKKNVDNPQEPAKASDAEIPEPISQPGQDEHQHPPAVEASQRRDENSLEPSMTDPKLKQDPPQPDVPRDGKRGNPFRDAGRVLPRDYEISELAEKHATETTSKRSEELPEAGAHKAKLKTGNSSKTVAGEHGVSIA